MDAARDSTEIARSSAAEEHATAAFREVADYELLFDCVHCGLCLEACPTYVVSRAEMDSPRGRIYLMKALAEGRLTLDADAVRHLDLCLGCRGCETACPSGVRYGRLIEGARVYVERNWRRRFAQRIRNRVISAVFPYPRRLRILLAPLRLAERLGMRRLLRRLAPAILAEWLDLVPSLEEQGHRVLAPAVDSITEGDAVQSTVVHHGCVAQVLSRSANLNSERLLARAGYRVVPLGRTVCCGALDLHNGNIERAREFARANVRTFKATGSGRIISAASGCAAVIAGYAQLLENDELAADACAVSARVADLSSLLLARGVPLRSQLRTVVTYHDSCHLAHGLGIREAPRQLLRSIAGVELRELAESDLCCGSAGSYNLTERKMARALARRKADNIIATGAEFVLMSNPGCELQIAAELKGRGSTVKVLHLADFLALASLNNSVRRATAESRGD